MKRDKKSINANLILLLFGRMISDTGSGIQMVVMPLYIIDAGGSAATVGLFSFLTLAPALLVYPFAGVLGDRRNRKNIMMMTDFASAAVILALAYAAYSDVMSIALLLVVQVIVSLLNGMFDPATKGMLPQLVARDQLTHANSTLASLRTLAVLVGPVIGAALYAKLGITVLFLINGISFLLSGMSSMLIAYTHEKRDAAASTGFMTDLSQGFRFIFSNKTISRLCIFFLVIYALVQPVFTVVLPLFFRRSLDYSDTQYGYLQMMFILGALVGSIVVGVCFGKEKQVFRPLFIGCSLLMGTMLLFTALLFPQSLHLFGRGSILYFVLLAAVLFLLSTAVMFINVPVQTFIQKETPNEYMSRVFSIVGLISKGGMPFGALIYGVMLNCVAAHWTILAATALLILISAIYLVSFKASEV